MKNTKKNAEKLAEEAVDQMDLDALCDIAREHLEANYAELSDEEFTNAWKLVFGED